MASETFLIMGGCGLLGRNIALDLLQSHPEAQVAVIDAAPPQAGVDRVTYLQGNLTDHQAIHQLLEQIRPTVVFHVASPRPFEHPLEFYMKVNVEGTRNLIDASVAVGVKAFIYTSSSSVVHDTVSDLVNTNESAPVLYAPQQPEEYHHTKALAESLVLQANRSANPHFTTAALRPSIIFGVGDEQSIASFVHLAQDGRLKWQIGDNENFVDCTYVENLARAHILTAERLLEASKLTPPEDARDDRVDGEAFFITNGEPVRFWDFGRSIAQAAGYPISPDQVTVISKNVGWYIALLSEVFVGLTSFGRRQATLTRKRVRYTTQIRIFDISKARTRLGYNPSISMQEGIKRSVAPFVEQARSRSD